MYLQAQPPGALTGQLALSKVCAASMVDNKDSREALKNTLCDEVVRKLNLVRVPDEAASFLTGNAS